eukprot:Gregarina_sp_Poly_1__11084@NODE_893_length_5825_cov_380_458666_g637_i0_p1_GENE_NODE_893_length_5825_cov_380_458666_g637_i0NODE_893_length_5825_cov_380_458666_g637_i0_p1_ORF_typecomplete_len710_score81_22POP1/PF06978_11/3_5e22POP1/PF06978_11/1_8e04POPLD/PF08170_12/8_6e03POPLD/PF08170_12/2_7e15HTH_21/PF13276_6/21HTH_21/PF13276_6/0_93_NODE_893_length_5825_cov_380_458666_g637_i022034332
MIAKPDTVVCLTELSRKKIVLAMSQSNDNKELPPFIDAKEFVVERKLETEKLLEILRHKKEGKRTFQKLHFEHRRRVQSHNPYRIPRRCRGPILRDMETAPPLPSKRPRKDRRRLRSISSIFGKRSESGGQWLETHLWHGTFTRTSHWHFPTAKRMKMSNIWGFKLAVIPTQKSKRKIYRHAHRRSVIYDESYFQCLELKDVKSFLKLCCHGPNLSRTSNFHEIIIFNADGTILCPAQLLMSQEQHYLFFHPAVRDQCQQLLIERGLDFTMIPFVNRFRLLGPDSWDLLTRIFSPRNCNGMPDAAFWELKLNYLHARILNGYCIHLQVHIPRLLGPFPPKTRNQWKNRPDYLNLLSDLHQPFPQLESFDLCRDPPKPENQEKFRHSLRSTRRVNSKQAVVKIRAAHAQTRSCLSPDATPKNTTADSPDSDLLVVFKFFGTLPEVLLIIPSNGGARNIWTLLNRQGCRAMGLENMRKLSLTEKRPLFPQHWMNTAGGRTWEELQIRRRAEVYERRPPSKRLAPRLLPPGFPFGGQWRTFRRWLGSRNEAVALATALLSAMRLEGETPPEFEGCGVLCCVEACAKGVPTETALLLVPPLGVDEPDALSTLTDRDSLPIIGSVVDGEHSLKLGKGFGFGVMNVWAYLNRIREVHNSNRRRVELLMRGGDKELGANSDVLFKSSKFRKWTSVSVICRDLAASYFWVTVTPLIQ